VPASGPGVRQPGIALGVDLVHRQRVQLVWLGTDVDVMDTLVGFVILAVVVVAAPFVFVALVWLVTSLSGVLMGALVIGAVAALVVGLYALYEG
jgi:hypothetical protein